MKNNILLILAVTIISIGIIIATVMISGAGNGKETSEPPRTGSTVSYQSQPVPAADTPEESSESTSQAQQTTASTTKEETAESMSYDSFMADNIIATAHSLIGIDFADGGDTPEAGFDNSGFIYYVLRENGYISCPRGVTAQSQMGTEISYDGLRPGDLAYFYADDMTTVSFGGIYCGDGIMVACLMPGTQVKEINIDSPYYVQHFYRGVSLT